VVSGPTYQKKKARWGENILGNWFNGERILSSLDSGAGDVGKVSSDMNVGTKEDPGGGGKFGKTSTSECLVWRALEKKKISKKPLTGSKQRKGGLRS